MTSDTDVRLRRENETLTQHLAAANQQLDRRAQEQAVLYHVGECINSMLPRERFLERILEAVLDIIDADEAGLMLVDQESGQLQTALRRQRSSGKAPERPRPDSTEEPLLATGRGSRPYRQDAAVTAPMMSVPLKVCGRVIGALGVSHHVSTRPFSGYDRQNLMALANYAAIAIENTGLYEEIHRVNQAALETMSLVADELHPPMAFICECASLLTKSTASPLTQWQEELITTILSHTWRIEALISDLRDISRIETDQLHLEMEPVQLATALEQGLRTIRGRIESRSQQLELEVPEDLPKVYADLGRLAQVLTNLLSYAHEHTPKDGQIRVRGWLEGEYVHCAVSDAGTSLPSEGQARLLTQSIRSDESTIRDIPGMGLGLCIAKSLVALHGGEFKVESHGGFCRSDPPGEGTTFTFTVPIVTGKQAGRGMKRAFTTPSALETWHGRKTDFSFTTPSALETWHGRHKSFAFTTPADLETWHGRKKRLAFTSPTVADD